MKVLKVVCVILILGVIIAVLPGCKSSAKTPASGQNIEQRWFPGSHADVGGGYADGLLHMIPLRWMQEKAEACGLEFSRMVAVPDGAYRDVIHPSFEGFLGGLYAKLPWEYPYYRPLGLGVNETIDDSVWERKNDAAGMDEHGKKYSPPALMGIPQGREERDEGACHSSTHSH